MRQRENIERQTKPITKRSNETEILKVKQYWKEKRKRSEEERWEGIKKKRRDRPKRRKKERQRDKDRDRGKKTGRET